MDSTTVKNLETSSLLIELEQAYYIWYDGRTGGIGGMEQIRTDPKIHRLLVEALNELSELNQNDWEDKITMEHDLFDMEFDEYQSSRYTIEVWKTVIDGQERTMTEVTTYPGDQPCGIVFLDDKIIAEMSQGEYISNDKYSDLLKKLHHISNKGMYGECKEHQSCIDAAKIIDSL